MKSFISFAILIHLIILTHGHSHSYRLETTGSNDGAQNSTVDSGVKVTLHNMGNTQYLGNITVGSNNVSLSVLFDTSAPWLWIPSAENSDRSETNNTDLYKSTESTTYVKPREENATLYYGNAQLNGSLAFETISLGQNQFTVKNQTILLSKVQKAEDQSNLNGVFGLGFSDNNAHASLLEILKSQQIIQNKIFSIYLEDNVNAWNSSGSEILFGGLDANKFKGKVVYAPLRYKNVWAVDLLEMKVGQKSLLESTKAKILKNRSLDTGTVNFSALIATSSNYMIVSANAINDLIAYLKMKHEIECYYMNENTPVCPCAFNNPQDFPNITITFVNQTLVLQPNVYIRRDGSMCNLLFIALNHKADQTSWKFGNVFLRTYYTVFDADNLQIGFAAAKHNSPQPLNFLNAAYVAVVFILLLMIIGFFVLVVKNLIGRKQPVSEVRNDSDVPILLVTRVRTNSGL